MDDHLIDEEVVRICLRSGLGRREVAAGGVGRDVQEEEDVLFETLSSLNSDQAFRVSSKQA